jgi:hypothetical protein
VTEEARKAQEAGRRVAPSVDEFLLGHIRDSPGERFGPIVRSAVGTCHVSRATAAIRLARLVRLGEVVLLPNRTYMIPGVGVPVARPVVETRWFEESYRLGVDGSAELTLRQEFRVVSGRLEHVGLTFGTSPTRIDWWCSAGAKEVAPPPAGRSGASTRYRFDFDQPLTAGDPSWQRFEAAVVLPHTSRLWRSSPLTGANRAPTEDANWESLFMQTLSQSPRFEERFASGAWLRLQIRFPDGYPVEQSQFRVLYETETNWRDTPEEVRIAQLSTIPGSWGGFRQDGALLSLCLQDPELDRRYEIRWLLPSIEQGNRWLAAESRKLLSFTRPKGPRLAAQPRRARRPVRPSRQRGQQGLSSVELDRARSG